VNRKGLEHERWGRKKRISANKGSGEGTMRRGKEADKEEEGQQGRAGRRSEEEYHGRGTRSWSTRIGRRHENTKEEMIFKQEYTHSEKRHISSTNCLLS
jgi:hypothetical protein